MGVVGAVAAARSLPSAAYRPTEQDVAVLRRGAAFPINVDQATGAD